MLEVFTDGSFYDNYMGRSVGGWAFRVVDSNTSQVVYKKCGKVRNAQSSSHCELVAVMKAIRYMKNQRKQFIIKSDSKETIDILKGIASPKANEGLWQELFAEPCRALKDVLLIPRSENKEADFAAKTAARSFIAQ